MIERLEFHISYKCHNRCIFCSESEQLARFKGELVEKEKLFKLLTYFSEKGIKHVSFTGGEPSFHKNLPDLLKKSRDLGLKTYVSSNGGRFSSKKFCSAVLPFLNEICFSIHGPDSQLHDFQTNNRGSFKNLLKALHQLKNSEDDIFCMVNVVVTRHNVGRLDEIVELLSKFKKIKLLLFSNLAPEGRGLENFENLAVFLKDIRLILPKMIGLAEKNRLQIRFFGVPLCILKGYEIASNDLWWSERVTVEQWKSGSKVFLRSIVSRRPVRQRIKTARCRSCSKKDTCGGVFKRYVNVFGDQELVPYHV